MAFLNLSDICVSYDKKTNVLEGLNLSIEKGELVSLLGPSGCGKTTTLRVVAGFIEPVSGDFILDGENLTKVPVHKRNFGLVFQSYALFPHLTVFDNVAFGLKIKKLSKEEINKRVMDIIEVCDLKGFEKRFPANLSGGQRQRVALARALVVEPKLLLLDEPLSNLDAKLRINMRVEIKRLQSKLGITTLFVTHDQEECFSISDKVAVMNGGVIEQFDTPENIYNTPKTEFVARFIGFENFIDLKHQGGNTYTANDGSTFTVDNGQTKDVAKGTIRPDNIMIVPLSDNFGNAITGTVLVRTFLGKNYQYELDTTLGKIVVNGGNEELFETGAQMKVVLPSNKIVLV